MVSVCTVPARGGRSCEHFGGYKTINRIPLPSSRNMQTIWRICKGLLCYLALFSWAFMPLIRDSAITCYPN